MSKREKRLQKLRQNPNDVSFEDLKLVLEAEGFEHDHTTGSHYIFRVVVANEVITLVIPFARPVKPVYVRKALAAIDAIHKSQVDENPDDD
jgi:predicted RNA binding protein YcfA (HicA-like mRNA interferase family)